MRSFLANTTTLIVGVLVYWIFSSQNENTWKWLDQFRNSTIETMKMMSSNSNNDIMPENLPENHSIVKSPLISESTEFRDEHESIGNHALRLALGSSSPSCQSLGLGSNSSDGQEEEGENATNQSSSEETGSSDTMNQTALSQNITVRKSTANSHRKQRVDESDDDFEVSYLDEHGGTSEEVNVDPSKSVGCTVELQLPEHIKTGSNYLFSSPVSPMMSPDSLRLSDGFERTMGTSYAAPLVVDPDIAGLSPILTSRESDIRTLLFSPSVEPRPGHSVVEVLVTHPEVETSTSCRIDSSRQENPNNSHKGNVGAVQDSESAGSEHVLDRKGTKCWD